MKQVFGHRSSHPPKLDAYLTRHSISSGPMLCAVVVFLVSALRAAACPIPVYQFALEWWERDAYEVYVFDTSALTEDEQAALQLLEGISSGQGVEAIPANIRLFHVRAESEDRLYAHAALRGEKPESLPWMAVYFPSALRRIRTPVWMGALNTENVKTLLDSPMRQKISELLANRVSTVWVLLESGTQRADAAAARVLEAEVKRLQDTLVPPDPSKWGFTDVKISDIRFEILRLSRTDPTEQMLVTMLLNSERDLKDIDAPMVFPIFGRGLMMNALAGAGINPQMIRETAEYLTGPCSCTVKSSSPGIDLLSAFDWKARVTPLTEKVTMPPGGLGGFLNSAEKMKQEQNNDN